MASMKKNIITLLLFFGLSPFAFAQSGMWTWMHGPNTPGNPGNYGTLGVTNPSNVPPTRYQAAYWADTIGNFWVFGGFDHTTGTTLNDMWKYDISTNMWTWMNGPQMGNMPMGNYGTKGVSSPLNIPPARGWGANCWTGTDGHLYLFGGVLASAFDDLWQYNISTNEWTWIHGNSIGPVLPNYGTKGVADPNNTPGGRQECKSGWTTPNHLWAFGGNEDNDLWSFDLLTNLWTWESGDPFSGGTGNYGTKGVASPTNLPPSRWSYTKWKDSKGILYIFAGANSFNLYNDLWGYDLNSKMWTWLNGTSVSDDLGNDVGACIEDNTNTPASRIENQTSQTTSECTNAFWSFGGFDKTGSNSFNDLWIYNASNNKWTLAWGNNAPYLGAGNYGSLGVASASNIIPSRGGVCIWTDKNQNLWVFGGLNVDPALNVQVFNDLWKFTPDTACFDIIASNTSFNWPSNLSTCLGQPVSINFPPGTQVTVSPNANTNYNTTSGILTLTPTGTNNYSISAQTPVGTPCPVNETKTIPVTVFQLPTAEFELNPQTTTLANPEFSTINTSQNATSYTWYVDNQFIANTTDITHTVSQMGHYCFKLVAENDCGKDSVTHCGDIVQPVFVPNAFSPNSDGRNDYFNLVTQNPVDNLTILVYNRWGENVFTGDNEHPKWDGRYRGRDCDVGSYYYQITYYLAGKQFVLKGDVNLVR